MMLYISSFLIFTFLTEWIFGRHLSSIGKTGKPCHTSGDCEIGQCCRNFKGDLLTLSGVFDHVGPIRMDDYNGTCTSTVAQLKEICSEFCPCDEAAGLECYRDVIEDGFIAPMCREKDFVNQKTKDFIECYNDPNCKLPIL